MRWIALTRLVVAIALVGRALWRALAASFGNVPSGDVPGGSPAAETPVVSTNEATEDASPAGPIPRRPREIFSILPEEGRTVCTTPEVGAGFSLSGAMLQNGQMDASLFSLTLDGRDVTTEAHLRGTMDFPQSRGELVYKPGGPLTPGSHEATLSFPDQKTGEAQTYTWVFDVEEIPCK